MKHGYATNSPVDVYLANEHEETMYMLRRDRDKNESDILAQFLPAYTLSGCIDIDTAVSPIILASPHSGRIYPKAWLTRCRVSQAALRKTEDIFVDRLFEPAAALGLPMLAAHFPRSFVDLNRSERERPPEPSMSADSIREHNMPESRNSALKPSRSAQPSARALAGLGVVPTRISQSVDIYNTTPSRAVVSARLDALYFPYHRALGDLIAATKARHGQAILLDCHSMPGFGALQARRSDFILGDRFGRACSKTLIDLAQSTLTALGYSVTRNHPYAGGFTTAHYGKPARGIHALQIEINRDLYVNPVTLKPKPGFDALRSHLTQFVKTLSDHSSVHNYNAEKMRCPPIFGQ